eukprot:11242416-Prorocentrum_lima.AAC.1
MGQLFCESVERRLHILMKTRIPLMSTPVRSRSARVVPSSQNCGALFPSGPLRRAFASSSGS